MSDTIVLISLNRCGRVGIGLGERKKGESELSKKIIIFLAVQTTIELVVFLGIRRETSWVTVLFHQQKGRAYFADGISIPMFEYFA
jgi:hypothetical protein